MAGRMRVPRTRGVFSGLLLVLLGAWAALVAFVGPYFHFAYTPDSTWTYTSDRLWMQILPGAGAALGGLIVLGSAHRAFASLGAWLAAICGAWLVVGPVLSTMPGIPNVGTPTGGTTRRALESLGFFYGVGVAIVFFAAVALGRFAVVGIREAQAAEREEIEAERLATMDNSALAATGLTGGFADRPDESTVDSDATRAMSGDSRWYPGSGPQPTDATTPVRRTEPGFGRHAEPPPAGRSMTGEPARTARPMASEPPAAAPTPTGRSMTSEPPAPTGRSMTGERPAGRSPTTAGETDSDRTTELPPAPPLSEQGEEPRHGLMDRLRPHHVGASSNRTDES